MAVENDFLAFATAVDANVETQAAYAASSFVLEGFASGIAQSQLVNKVWRQGAFGSAMLAQYIVNITGQPMVDDGDLAGKVALLQSAVQISAGVKQARIVTSSANMNVLLTDYRVGFARVAGVAALNASLPAVTNANIGQSFKLGDIQGNANAAPITVIPPGGHNIANLPGNWIINVNRAWFEFCYMGNSTWSLEQ